nr:hypothetical protein [Tanacetum cinerariifolium]
MIPHLVIILEGDMCTSGTLFVYMHFPGGSLSRFWCYNVNFVKRFKVRNKTGMLSKLHNGCLNREGIVAVAVLRVLAGIIAMTGWSLDKIPRSLASANNFKETIPALYGNVTYLTN